MSNTCKQSPLGINANSALLQGVGLCVNPRVIGYVGISKTNTDYSFGSLVSGTCLRLLTWAINDAFNNIGNVQSAVYDTLISIGDGIIPVLGNAPPSGWPKTASGNDTVTRDISWAAEATTGYGISGDTGGGQSATWIPYNYSNINSSVTQWGFLRCFTLQAWNEFNWNGDYSAASYPYYKDFCNSFLQCDSFVDLSNVALYAMENGKTHLKGVYSNMNDLISSDITGVTLSTSVFGQDCITLGKVIDLSQIGVFGLPSSLLRTLKKYNAITQSLSLSLLASGLDINQINGIINNTIPFVSVLQEQQIYGAFLIIVGQDLRDILIPLNCKTKGLVSLADLLDVKKIFPNSYLTLTVPLYNTNPSIKTSKIYYPIYDGNGINSRLTLPNVVNQVGSLTLPGTPQSTDRVVSSNEYQPLSMGFGSKLDRILPNDIAVAAGAFSASIQQIKNIDKANFESFAQVVYSTETIKGYPLVNGTDIPTNTALSTGGQHHVSFGSGPYGTYNMSDFFGCMSGLPYPWEAIYGSIVSLQTTKLANTYRELFLATSWKAALGTVQYSLGSEVDYVGPGPEFITYYKYYWQITGITLTERGGGYGRGTAPIPTVVITGGSGATASVTSIGTDDLDVGSVGTGTFGRVLTLVMTYAGTRVYYASGELSPTPTIPVNPPEVHIQCPPTATLPISSSGEISTSGVNTAYGTTGWTSPMNSVMSAYITQANTEIIAIYQRGFATSLNLMYDSAAKQMMLEQRERFHTLDPVPIPRDGRLSNYPLAIYGYIDSVPSMAKKTDPHMSAQTIEAISDLSTPGGQSLAASLRQERNQARLIEAGIPLDNNVPGTLSENASKLLLVNGTIPLATSGVTVPNVGTFTNPAIMPDVCPIGYVDPNTNTFLAVKRTTGVNLLSPVQMMLAIPDNGLNYLGPILDGTGPALPEGTIPGPMSPAAGIPGTDIAVVTTAIIPGPGVPVDRGQAVIPGSLASSPAINILPPELNMAFASGTIPPSTYSVQEAINAVIKANCDCWCD